jgi:hypothetical protein
MSNRNALMTAVLTVGLGLGACASTKQEMPVATPEMDPEAMMAAYTEANAMNENHHRMAELVGNWDVAGKSWMAPDQPPMESTGTAEFTQILGGRYLRQDYNSEFMGMPYQGFAISGYDNARKVHVDYWFDSMGTDAYVSEGNWDAAGTTYTSQGEHLNPVTGVTEGMKNVITRESGGQFVFTMYALMPDGSFVKSMELTYTRKK